MPECSSYCCLEWDDAWKMSLFPNVPWPLSDPTISSLCTHVLLWKILLLCSLCFSSLQLLYGSRGLRRLSWMARRRFDGGHYSEPLMSGGQGTLRYGTTKPTSNSAVSAISKIRCCNWRTLANGLSIWSFWSKSLKELSSFSIKLYHESEWDCVSSVVEKTENSVASLKAMLAWCLYSTGQLILNVPFYPQNWNQSTLLLFIYMLYIHAIYNPNMRLHTAASRKW